MVTPNATLDDIISTVGELPASPAIVSSLMSLTSDLDSTVDDVSKVLSSDQSLTARVLKLSNSPYYGRAKGVASLEDAIFLLGFFTVRSMVIATSAHQIYNRGGGGGNEAKLWRHSLSTAVASRQIARRIKHPGKDEIFIAALLHDIGKLVMLEKLSGRYLNIVRDVEQGEGEFVDVERRELGFDHTNVAVSLLRLWSFPENLIDAVSAHHDLPDLEEGQPVPMSYVINLGNYMAKKMGVGFEDHRFDTLAELPSARAMEFDESTLNEMYEEVCEHYEVELKIIEGH